MPQPARADCIACDNNAPVFAIGDAGQLRVEIRRINDDGTLLVRQPSTWGGYWYSTVTPDNFIPMRRR